jgi:hypothetical protein
MKKMLTLLAVAAIPAMFGGCAACCPTGLCATCPCCPCNWFNRGAPCPPAPEVAAPLVAAPAPYPPAVAPTVTPQYVAPLAAPFAAAPAPYPSPCATWNPCQGVVTAPPVPAQPQAATCCPPQMYAQTQPMYYQAPPAYYGEPGCGYAESSCGAPFAGVVSYGPEMPVEYGPCASGCCDGGVATPPAPEVFVEPRPAAE